ncbi:hypothetical protein NUW58_g5897 [Xylaria curta]|uniref:Uncharacterized protein n=1 Tax=Xylaria curta TaxID=42375 RepID=A0ACC1P0K6_9PEZI|nr:hypothetical protein NUW58_g5897 [Xylaria curta]
MTGFLIPPHFVPKEPSRDDVIVASTVWGVSLAVSFFTASKASKQTWRAWKRTKRASPYVIMVFFFIITLWAFQIQCIMQILVNRISLITRDQRKVNRLKWTVAGVLLLVNFGVYIIWIPAHLQISPIWIQTNEIWDRVEKVIFALVDLSLSAYFAYLVRSSLIANGLLKYNRLFHFNVVMIFFSLSLDIVLIAVIPLGNGFIYLVFHPLVYLLKLHIELNLTDLLAKIVRVDEGDSFSHPTGSKKGTGKTSHGHTTVHQGIRMATLITANRDNVEADNDRLKGGIKKTVETEIRYTKDESDAASGTSSTKNLYSPFEPK